MNTKVRVRFAPSPTGPLHIGGVRTALYNYLFAKKNKGDFIVRIEDTDQKRYVADSEKYIKDSLEWCGIFCDESPQKGGRKKPYRQSERKYFYKKYAHELIEKGAAYYAFDTPDSLEVLRKNSEQRSEKFVYNAKNRMQLQNALVLQKTDFEQKIKEGMPYVIRFKMPENKTIILEDLIRGTIKINTNHLDDKILFKSDGMPTYHLANVVDDYLMQISHVIRGEEWLSSLALHMLLYEALGWQPPKFAHLPLILKPVGKGKLSKRDGDKMGFPVFPLDYKKQGYFKEAFINMLALLGWNDGTENEIFSMQELIANFSLEKVSKSGARFSIEKAKWLNAQHLQKKSNEALAKEFQNILEEKSIKISLEKIIKIVNVTKERAVFVKDFWELGHYFLIAPKNYDAKSFKKIWNEKTHILMQEFLEYLEKIENFTTEPLEKQIKKWIAENKISFGKIMQPLRLALVGSLKGVSVFEIMDFIGKKETLERIGKILKRI